MMRAQMFQHGPLRSLLLAGALFIVTAMFLIEAPSASAVAATKKSKPAVTAAEATARRYAEAMGAGNTLAVGQLDFSCQHSLVAAAPHGIKRYPANSDPVYDSCRQRLQNAHASTVVRTDVGMEVLWPVTANWFFSAKMSAAIPPQPS